MSSSAPTPVPFQDLRRLHDSIKPEIDAAIADVLERTAFVGAKASASFEAAFAAAHGVDHAVGVGSGTDALALALRGLGIGPGDEVIVPSMTFIATAEAVCHVGATPVVADVDPVSLLISEEAVAAARTERTAAVMPVHLYGHVVSFDLIRRWRESGLRVIEDAAQAHLATWGEASVGSAGDVACFSFYPGKNLGALGDGGAVITNDADVAARVAKLRDHGRESKYLHDEIGWCSRLDGLQAAVLEVKLRHLPEWTANRQSLASLYHELLGDSLVPWERGAVHHLMVLRTSAVQRDKLSETLAGRGVGVGIHYPVALSQQPSMAPFTAVATPVAELAAAEILSLPMDPLMTPAEVEFVCDEIDSFS